MTKSTAGVIKGSCSTDTGINASKVRTSWMINNAIPDSITMNIVFRNLVPSVATEPKVRSNEVILGLSPVTLKILNTIMPVTRVFTAIDAVKPVIYNAFGQ